jgi:hypothetical protein
MSATRMVICCFPSGDRAPIAEAGPGTKAKASRNEISGIVDHDAGHAHDATTASLKGEAPRVNTAIKP